MDEMTPNNKQERRHQAANSYTEEQARLLLAMRDMVKWEVERQLKEILKSNNKISTNCGQKRYIK